MRNLAPLLILLTACSAEQQPPEATLASELVALDQGLAARNFIVQPGRFEFLDMSSCCDTSCSGNNPSSPYATFFVPPAPSQSAPNPSPRPDGLASSYRLRHDEAIVFVGSTPPPAAYFGFTPYLMTRAAPDGAEKKIFASMSETLNHLVIRATSTFEGTTAIIVAADRNTSDAARAALVDSGVPDSAINVMTLDPAIGRFGLGSGTDTFGVLFRMALVADPAKELAYLTNPGGTVYRITPRTTGTFAKLPSPSPRPKATSPTETSLRPAVQRLGDAIVAAYPGYTARALSVDDGVPDPMACITNLTFCAGDNRDTTYPGTNVRVVFSDPDEFYVAFGVDHAKSGKTVYANTSVYALEKLVGLASVASDEYAKSARRYQPNDPTADKLYAWKLARSCNGEPFCLEIPYGTCPTGMPDGALGTINFRTYLEPSSKTAPLPSTLVRDRIFAFKRR